MWTRVRYDGTALDSIYENEAGIPDGAMARYHVSVSHLSVGVGAGTKAATKAKRKDVPTKRRIPERYGQNF